MEPRGCKRWQVKCQRDVRVGKVQLGSVSFRERFIIADVTTPLLALGSIVRAGLFLHADGTKQYLCKGQNG